MSGQASQAGESLGNAIKKGVGMFHGAGEAIRGNVNAAVDSAAGDKQSAARHEETASHGAREMDQGYSRHHQGSAGTTHTGLDRDNNMNSSNYGPHDTNLGNKMDPRFDSDLDGRGTTSGSTNYGPHDTNLGNKMDPRYDSDLDNRGTTTGSTNYGPHETNMANRMDPRFDAEMNTRK